MKRYRTKTAIFLLAIYLPVWLLSSFHVHAHPIDDHHAAEEQPSSEMDEDGCLCCQFMQLFYEDTPQASVTVSLHETIVETAPIKSEVLSVSDQLILLRAPPVLL